MPQSLFSFDEIPNLLIFDKIDSTSKEIFRMIDNGFAANGDIVIADVQTEGHGRSGRVWESQQGNLFASFLLQANMPIDKMTFVGFLLAKNTIETLKEISSKKGVFSFKWPNDILLNNKKITGILIQSNLAAGTNICNSMVCGLGINVKHHPNYVESTDLFHELQIIADKNDILFSILQKFEIEYHKYLELNDMTEILTYLKNNSNFIGNEISVHSGQNIKQGICKDIDKEGNLILVNGDKEEVVFSADVINLV